MQTYGKAQIEQATFNEGKRLVVKGFDIVEISKEHISIIGEDGILHARIYLGDETIIVVNSELQQEKRMEERFTKERKAVLVTSTP